MKLKRDHTLLSVGCISFLFMMAYFVTMAGASEIPKAQLPAVITSLGQSPDAYTVNVLAKRAKLKIDYNNILPANEVANYKTLLMVVGASLKGFGSAGINLDSEISRGKAIAKAAKEKNIFLVVAHTGGEGRREEMSDKLLDAVAFQADYLLVLEAGNEDGYFTKLSDKHSIPLTRIKMTFEVQDVLKEMFSGQ